jgi:hypothetical protein
VWCYKKSLRKLLTVASESPNAFTFPKEMEEKYGDFKAGPEYKAAKDGRRYWFRQHMSTDDLLSLAQTGDFKPYKDDPYQHAHDYEWDEGMDAESGCGATCEAFTSSDDTVTDCFSSGDEDA